MTDKPDPTHADRPTRREFVARATAAGLTVGVLGPRTLLAADAPSRREEPVISCFSKHLMWLPLAEVGPVVAESGFRAVDLLVRPDGHVLPDKVETDLPRAVETLRKSGLTVPLITTGITDARDPLSRRVLETAKKVGVTHYRMGNWAFPASPEPLQALRELRPRAAAIAALGREIGIHGGYQNHVGTQVGGSVWDLGVMLEGVDVEGLGVQYDIRHAMVEGGQSWPVTLRMIAPHIDTVAIKDFRWERSANGRWRPVTVPLGEGMVDFPAYLKQILAWGPLPPSTMHFEYPPLEMAGGGDATRRQQTIDGMRRDLTRYQQFIAAASAPAASSSTSKP